MPDTARTAQQPAPARPADPAAAGSAVQQAGTWLRRARALLVRHWLFAAVLTGAAALRAVVMLGYPPAMWFNDSYSYVSDALHLSASAERPSGYPFFLLILEPFHSFGLVVALQHLMGLGMGVAIYALLRRRGLPAWAAALAAVPVLYDAYEVQLEQAILSDVLFMALTTAAVVLLCWQERISVRAAVIAGVLIGGAQLVRSVGLPMLVVVAVCLLAWRVGWRPVVALLAAGAVPIAAYMLVFYAQHRELSITGTESQGTFLYGRVQTFAQCSVIKPPPSLRPLCDPRPLSQRPVATEYIWRKTNPEWQLHQGLWGGRINSLTQAFALRAIEAQPLAYLRAVNADFWRSFTWSRTLAYDYRTDHLYLFSIPPPQIPPTWHELPMLSRYQPGVTEPHAVQPFAGFLRGYQREVYLRGTLLGVILLIGLAGIAARWRRWGGQALLPWLVATLLLVLPVAVADFDYRYLLAVTPLACLAGGLAFARRHPPGPAAGRQAQGEAIRAS